MEKHLIEAIALREAYRENYFKKRDPIAEDRMRWRAQSFRHLVHLLPRQRILEIGCGAGLLTRSLVDVSRGECPITAITFQPGASRPLGLPEVVEFCSTLEFQECLGKRHFDLVITQDLLDHRTCAWLTQHVYELLAPGGRAVFYESNPWNVFLRVRRAVSRLFGHNDPRLLLSRADLYELLSEVGFTHIFAVYNDFVYAPITRHLAWFLRNLSIVLENTPFVRTLAGSILVYAEKSPRPAEALGPSMAVHSSLHRAISVVVPCHNEETNVGRLVAQLTSLFDEYICEFILVNDNSKDQTGAVIDAMAAQDPRIKPIHRRAPNGVGRALADGIRVATGKYLLLMDCDFQQLVPELRDLFDAAVEGNDVVVGSRFSRHSVLLNYPLKKIIANRVFHVLAQLLLLIRFRDLTNNLKLMRRQVAAQLQILEPGFAANAEIGFQPLIMGYRIKEVPISWIGRGLQMGTSSFALLNAGGGYWRVLRRIWVRRFFGIGAYRDLRSANSSRVEGPDKQ